nr:PREDICTED: uncharacterized protein MAL13P1.336-like [Bemisia tabaci]
MFAKLPIESNGSVFIFSDKKSFIHRLGLIKSEKDGVPDLKHMAKNCQVNSMNSMNSLNNMNNMNSMNSMNSVGAGANSMGFLHGNNLGPSASELYENLLMHSSNDRQHYLSNALSISQRYLDQLQNCNTGVVALHNNSASNNSYVDYYESSSDVSTAEMSMQEYSMNSSGNNSMLMEYRPRKHNKDKEPVFGCEDCGKRYRSKTSLSLHKRLECGKEPAFACPFCPLKTHQKGNLQVHIKKKHSNPREFPGHTLT